MTKKKQFSEALEYHSRALMVIGEETPGGPEHAVCLYNVGETARLTADHHSAERHLGEALAIRQRLMPESV